MKLFFKRDKGVDGAGRAVISVINEAHEELFLGSCLPDNADELVEALNDVVKRYAMAAIYAGYIKKKEPDPIQAKKG